jgi:transglutaminase-like putative cysteine protease
MMAPPLLVGAALVAWSWGVGLLPLGIALAIAFELLRFSKKAVALGDVALARMIRLTLLAALVAFGYSIATQRAPQSLYGWLRWLPVFLLPLPFLQALGGGTLSRSVLRDALRFGGAAAPRDPRPWDATHGYALCCIVAIGTLASAERWYFAAAFAGIAWGLVARMKTRRIAGFTLLACAGLLAFGVSTGLYRLQAQLEEWGEEWFESVFAADPDPFRERTRIGELGRIKLNDRILMRALPEGPRPSQILLREASFDTYRNGSWESSRRTLAPVPRDGDRWKLRAGEGNARVVVRRSFPRGDGLLPLPPGSASIGNLDAATLEASDTGSVRAKGANGIVSMRIDYDEDAEAGTFAADLDLPEQLKPVLERIADEEGLRAGSAAAAIRATEKFFASRFAYTLQLSSPREGARSLADFLLRDHKGHCEYFASATVLLLRQAGVPARYAVGYSAQEFSALEKAFLVRHRHAHAWALAFVDGRWRVVDTTPAIWAEQEAEGARSPLGAILDVLSWAWDALQRAWASGEGRTVMIGALAGLALLAMAVVLGRRIAWRRGVRSAKERDRVVLAWRRIEERVAALGHARGRQETVREWVGRLKQEGAGAPWRASLEELADAYYRSLFDPECPHALRERFLERARRWSPAVQSSR